jgi:zinc-ribbon domain
MKSKVSPVLFLVTVLCFLLPFVTVSCNGQKIATFSGTDLAFGTTINQPQAQQPFGFPQPRRGSGERVKAEPVATMAFLCAIAGIGLSFLAIRLALVPAITGALGTLLLFALQLKLNDDISKRAQGAFQLDFQAGFILALLLFIAAAGWNGWLFFMSRRPGMAASQPLANAAAAGSGGTTSAAFCPNCGQPLSSNAKFCGGCGKAV